MKSPDIRDLTNPEIAANMLDALEFAEKTGNGLYARQASEFAPAHDRELDTVVLVLRGQQARDGRDAVAALADLLRKLPVEGA